MTPIKEDKSKKPKMTFVEEKAEIIEKSIALSEKVAVVEKKQFVRFSSEIYISSFAKESILKCKLKENAPDQVSVKAGCYLTGQRVFNRMDQPFKVTEAEWNSVINRGQKHFYLVKR